MKKETFLFISFLIIMTLILMIVITLAVSIIKSKSIVFENCYHLAYTHPIPSTNFTIIYDEHLTEQELDKKIRMMATSNKTFHNGTFMIKETDCEEIKT